MLKNIQCSLCKKKGHNKRTCLNNTSNSEFDKQKLNSQNYKSIVIPTHINMYNETIMGIINAAKIIDISNNNNYDGRINSIIDELPFLQKLKSILINKFPNWIIQICPPRSMCDIIINSIQINLKIT